MIMKALITFCTFLLLIFSIEMSAQSKYAINEDFTSACRITPPLGRGVLRIGNAFLTAMPKGMRSDKQLSIRKVKITSSVDGESVRAWVIAPKVSEEKLPAILFLHGGGFVFKAAPYHYDLAKSYALCANAVVVLPDYRMAYNNKYNVPLQDCCDMWHWLLANADALGIDSAKLGIVGDSAGGFLAVKTVLWATDHQLTLPAKLMLVYPVIDCTMRTLSMKQFTDTPVWNAELNRKMWSYYLQENHETSLLDFSPPQSFPTTYLETAEFDCLRDEGDLFAEMLRASAVQVQYTTTQGTMHGFDMVQKSKITIEQVENRCQWLKTW